MTSLEVGAIEVDILLDTWDFINESMMSFGVVVSFYCWNLYWDEKILFSYLNFLHPLEVGDNVAGGNGEVVSFFNIWVRQSNSDLVEGLIKGPMGFFLFNSSCIKCSEVVLRWLSIEAIRIRNLSGIRLAVSVCLVECVSSIKTKIYW